MDHRLRTEISLPAQELKLSQWEICKDVISGRRLSISSGGMASFQFPSNFLNNEKGKTSNLSRRMDLQMFNTLLFCKSC